MATYYSGLVIIVLIYVKLDNAQNCTSFEWACDTGDQCIAQENLCDGQVQCKDRSDEVALHCQQYQCMSFAFRCAYGACVIATAECNGVQECADNSDEETINCLAPVDVVHDLSGNCTKYEEFQCLSSQCIAIIHMCDGVMHCQDGSDETELVCRNEFCPAFAFRCKYGACVRGEAECDMVKDCADDSDESEELCGFKRSNSTSTNASRNNVSCVMPQPPEHGFVVYAGDPSVTLQRGSVIAEYIEIEYHCSSKFVLIGNLTNYCLNGNWLNASPKCEKYCDYIPLQKISINVICEFQNRAKSCKELLPPGTRVTISCADGYARPQRLLPDSIVCDQSGNWHSQPWQCYVVCGEVKPDIVPLMVGGEEAKVARVPWHAAIYMYNDFATRNDFICGGSIISTKLVISAAHCFWNPSEGVLFDKTLFLVGVGKTHRLLTAKEVTRPQFFNVTNIIVNERYKLNNGLFDLDIAIVTLSNHIIYRPYILPVCIDFRLSGHTPYVPTGIEGLVSGWGQTESDTDFSDVLKVLRLPSLNNHDCIRESAGDFVKYITSDKFCTASDIVSRGDSGGGLVIPRDVGGVEVFYLYGIVSNGPWKEESCDNTKYALFTNIYKHLPMINDSYFDYIAH